MFRCVGLWIHFGSQLVRGRRSKRSVLRSHPGAIAELVYAPRNLPPAARSRNAQSIRMAIDRAVGLGMSVPTSSAERSDWSPSPGSGSRLPHAESSRAAFRNQSTAGRCHCKASETQGISDCSSAPAAVGRCIPAADNRCPPEPDYVDIWRRVRTSDLVFWISLGPTPGFSAPSKRRGISRLEPGPF